MANLPDSAAHAPAGSRWRGLAFWVLALLSLFALGLGMLLLQVYLVYSGGSMGDPTGLGLIFTVLAVTLAVIPAGSARARLRAGLLIGATLMAGVLSGGGMAALLGAGYLTLHEALTGTTSHAAMDPSLAPDVLAMTLGALLRAAMGLLFFGVMAACLVRGVRRWRGARP